MEMMLKIDESRNEGDDLNFLSIVFKNLFHTFFNCYGRQKIIKTKD